MTAHAQRVVEEKGFDPEAVQAVWESPLVTYPSGRHPGQHKRIGGGLCLACDDATGRVITVFVDQEITELRPDQKRDRDALKWARKNGLA
jgi:hypothetical protein